jgi:hypothetical protein
MLNNQDQPRQRGPTDKPTKTNHGMLGRVKRCPTAAALERAPVKNHSTSLFHTAWQRLPASQKNAPCSSPARRERRFHFALPQQLHLGAPHAFGKLRIAGGFRDLFQSLPAQTRPADLPRFPEAI